MYGQVSMYSETGMQHIQLYQSRLYAPPTRPSPCFQRLFFTFFFHFAEASLGDDHGEFEGFLRTLVDTPYGFRVQEHLRRHWFEQLRKGMSGEWLLCWTEEWM